MASKLIPRASRLLRPISTPQYRSFSAAPQRLSDSLMVVRIPIHETPQDLSTHDLGARAKPGMVGKIARDDELTSFFRPE